MYKLLASAFIVCILFILPIALWAQGKIIVDPNTPGAQPAGSAVVQKDEDAPDLRLDQKITYKAESKKLPEVLAEISAKTGVFLKTSSEKRFWSVRQRKVTLYLKDMPLREFMDQLETLLDYHFSRSGKPGQYYYILWQNLNGKDKEQEILKAQKELKEQHRKRAIEETLRDTELALMMTPEQAKAIQGKNPWLAYLAGTPRGRAYAELLQSIPREEFDKLLKDEHYGFHSNLSELSSQGQEALRKIDSLINYQKLDDEIWKGRLGGKGTVTSISIRDPNTDSNDNNPTPAASFWLDVCAAPSVSTGATTETFGVDTFLIARSDVPMSETRTSPGCTSHEELRARSKLSALLRAKKQGDKEEVKPDSDLKLKANYKDAKQAKDQKRVNFELEQLYKLFGLNVLYEYYPIYSSGIVSYGATERELSNVLRDINREFSLKSTKTGKTIRFRHLNWTQQRSWEIPLEWVNKWQKSIEQKQELDLDNLADITSKMTKEQIEHNFSRYNNPPSSSIDDSLVVELFNTAGINNIESSRKFIELYSRLTASQKNRMWSAKGIPFDEIANDPILQGASPSMGKTPLYDMTLSLSKGKSTNPSSGNTNETINLNTKMKVWLKDIPSSERDKLLKGTHNGTTTKIDNDSLEITQSAPIAYSDREQVKLLIDQREKQINAQ